uniref:3'-5' exonuclease domain-containing protein n=2 Tax=Strongyloides stercoralis TaxID=6248 RepID=A0A0K0ELZ1_STRER
MISRISILEKNLNDLFIQLKRSKCERQMISQKKAFEFLNWSVKLRYEENEIDSYQLNDIAYDIISQYPVMKPIFTEILKKKNDFKELERWKLLNIKSDLFPKKFPFKEKEDDSLYVENSKYLGLPKNISVKMCSLDDEIEEAITAIETSNKDAFSVVGFDCEWSPLYENEMVSIIQVSLNDKCFIIDNIYGNHKLIIKFIKNLFSAENLIKLGKDPKNDLKYLLKCYPNIDILKKPSHTICLTNLITNFNTASSSKLNNKTDKKILNIEFFKPNWKELFYNNDLQTNLEKENRDLNKTIQKASFSKLCKLILDKELNKSEQISIWDRKPLRISQLRYAALDAEASRMIYYKLEEWGKILNIDVKNIAHNCFSKKVKKI